MANPVKAASFLGLPTEIRCRIMNYLIPRWERHERSLCLLPVIQEHERDLYYKREKVPIWIPSMVSLWSATEFLLLNRQIHAEALGMSTLHNCVPHQLNINEESFWCNAPEEMVESATKKTDWNVEQLFPTSNLSKVQEIIIEIKPTDFPGFWSCLSMTLESLCNGRLLQQTPLKKLTVRLYDMMHTCAWDTKYSTNWAHLFQYGMPVEACFADYQSALHSFRALAGKVIQLEIELPTWMEFAEGMEPMREDMSREMLTDTKVIFAPMDSRDIAEHLVTVRGGPEVLVQREYPMAALAKDEAKRAEVGMTERVLRPWDNSRKARHEIAVLYFGRRAVGQVQDSWYY